MPPPDPRTDQELVDALNRGETAAFDAFYFRYRDWVYRLAFRFTGSDADAADVLQETFKYLLSKTGRLTLTARMTTLLYPAVKNLSLAARRARARYVGSADAYTLPVPAAATEGTPRGELAAVLAGLSEAHRETVLMRFVDDMSLEEIAAALGVPVGTVKSRLHHALAMLREDPRTRRYFSQETALSPEPPSA